VEADVAVGDGRVLRLGQHCPVRSDQQRAERRVAGSARGRGQLDRASEEPQSPTFKSGLLDVPLLTMHWPTSAF